VGNHPGYPTGQRSQRWAGCSGSRIPGVIVARALRVICDPARGNSFGEYAERDETNNERCTAFEKVFVDWEKLNSADCELFLGEHD